MRLLWLHSSSAALNNDKGTCGGALSLAENMEGEKAKQNPPMGFVSEGVVHFFEGDASELCLVGRKHRVQSSQPPSQKGSFICPTACPEIVMFG